MSLVKSVRFTFPEWEENNVFPAGLDHIKVNNEAEIRSYTWNGEIIRRARACELVIPGKFTAETLVIYPHSETDTPIFGTEYITIADKKFFGAIDFHPLSQDPLYLQSQIQEYLYDFPDRDVEQSRFYDLSTYFSPKFWIHKSPTDFHEDYIGWVDRYMGRYRMALMDGELKSDNIQTHIDYDIHMAANDPAHGILKAYFSQEFADFYVNKFLFDLSKQ